MIKSWKSSDLETVFYGGSPKGFPASLVPRTRRLLAQLNTAVSPIDMKAPPGNRLHQLSGDLIGVWSISVNMQFRITFTWSNGDAYNVWFGDYH
jgi:toxin HigB-1